MLREGRVENASVTESRAPPVLARRRTEFPSDAGYLPGESDRPYRIPGEKVLDLHAFRLLVSTSPSREGGYAGAAVRRSAAMERMVRTYPGDWTAMRSFSRSCRAGRAWKGTAA